MNELAAYAVVMISLLAMTCVAQTGEQPNYLLAVASSMVKVHRQMQRNSPAAIQAAGEALQLDGARGGYVHGQVVIMPREKDLTGVTWSAEPLQGPRGLPFPYPRLVQRALI